jgi:2-polyprenyl-3-methyl-5-hydroxy-6-metoxy-1,4-benzoquinol methylase
LLTLAKNKKILHIGFVDHLPLIDKKIAEGNWLHKNIIDVSNLCYGIDINREGVQYIKEKYNYKNLYALDIVKDELPPEIREIHFDYMFIPDVIEHVGNPVAFLSALRKRFCENVDTMVLTTPNAFRLNNFVNVFKNIEVINTDHRFWFTPYTISKILIDSGLFIKEIGLYEHGRLSRRQIFKKTILSKYSLFKNTIIVNTGLSK